MYSQESRLRGEKTDHIARDKIRTGLQLYG